MSGALARADEVDPAANAGEEQRAPQRVGVVGLGYWGPNLARNLAAIPGCELRWLCDPRAEARARAARTFAGVRTSAELDELLADPDLDAVLLATPVATRAELAASVLEAASTASWRSLWQRAPARQKGWCPRRRVRARR